MVSWKQARALALSFPDVEEDTSGRARFRVRGKAFAWIARERDGGGLAVRVDREEKQLILDANPEVYFTSPHYNGYPAVQVRLEEVEVAELRERLEDAWLIQAPKRLAAEYVASSPDCLSFAGGELPSIEPAWPPRAPERLVDAFPRKRARRPPSHRRRTSRSTR